MIGEEVIAYYGDAGDGEELFEKSKLVRCKDCKHWNDFYSKCTKWTVDTYEQAQTNAEDFCSYGERKAE